MKSPVPTFDPLIEAALHGMLRGGKESGASRMRRYVLAVVLDHERRGELPTNNRFVFYELEGFGVVRKTRTTDPTKRGTVADPRESNVNEALMQLRAHGIVPWWWISDEERTLTDWEHAPTVADYLAEANDRARINPWDGPPPLLLIEARATAGVLQNLAARYVCPIAATRGQAGGFLHTDIAPILTDDRPVFYLGDWDLQGHQIENHTRRVLERDLLTEIPWTRLAITQEQIEERGIEPRWKTDTRYKPPKTQEAWEAESLTQSFIVQLVTDALDDLIPEPIEDVLEREEAERAYWQEQLDDDDDGLE